MDMFMAFVPLLILLSILLIPFITARYKIKKYNMQISCNKCSSQITNKWKISFLGYKKLECQFCNDFILKPLSSGMKISYVIILALLLGTIYNEFNIITFIFIILIMYALMNDLKIIMSDRSRAKR